MPEKHTARRFSEYNRILKENDELYRSAVKTMGLPDCAFWILYTLRESSETLTQSDVCYTLSTVFSASLWPFSVKDNGLLRRSFCSLKTI